MERCAELLQQIARAREPVRLKKHMDALESALARGGKRGPDLSWMVAVIVNHADIGRPAFELEAPVDTAKVLQGLTDALWFNIQPYANSHGGCSIEHIMI